MEDKLEKHVTFENERCKETIETLQYIFFPPSSFKQSYLAIRKFNLTKLGNPP
jgi:hypothetical protein